MLKVFLYRSGNQFVATPVTRGRRPKPKVFSDRRTYAQGRSKSAALASLAQTLGVETSNMEVTPI